MDNQLLFNHMADNHDLILTQAGENSFPPELINIKTSSIMEWKDIEAECPECGGSIECYTHDEPGVCEDETIKCKEPDCTYTGLAWELIHF